MELPVPPALSTDELRFLSDAAAFLERPSFLTTIGRLIGKPAEAVMAILPDQAQRLIDDATHAALRRGIEWVAETVPARQTSGPVDQRRFASFFEKHRHTALTMMSGAGGGFFGLAGLPVEIPLTTLVMLRSIACIAAESGADVSDPLVRMECLMVLALGARPEEDMPSVYFATRLGMALAVKQGASLIAASGGKELSAALAQGTGTVLGRLISAVAARFEVVVTEKVAAQAMPVLGAAMGALINAGFTDHFNRIARYHFGIIALEREYGGDVVEAAYLLGAGC